MATLWDVVTGNSSLPVQPGNTFWDHLNNQAGGGEACITIYGESLAVIDPELLCTIDPVAVFTVVLEGDILTEIEEPYLTTFLEGDIIVTLEGPDHTVEICNGD